MRKIKPEKVFYDHITRLIRGLLINNKSYKYEEYVSINDTKERASYILEEIESTKHLINLE